ncbi:MAG: DedA family protein [Christensenellaceae bacterium]|jgi:membrane protein DedA with SNARE-associated domain|nr:DedA family protein [Christensenellaceae bacterium]
MKDIIISIINKFGYSGIFVLIAIENIFPPIPSEIILTFGGFATTISSLEYIWVIASATAGSMLGAMILYFVGRILKQERLEKLVDGKFGKIFRLKKSDIQKSSKWFTKHGTKAVFFGRFIPIIRSLVSIPAGISGMKLIYFIPLTLIGTLFWNTVLVLLGRAAGAAWERIAGVVDTYSLIALIIIVVLLGVGLIVFIKMRVINPRKRHELTPSDIKITNIGNNSIQVDKIDGAMYKLDDLEWTNLSHFTDLENGRNYIIHIKYITAGGIEKICSLEYKHATEGKES